MSRILVSNDARTVAVEITQDVDGFARGVCEAGDWETEPGRADSIVDVLDHAGTHIEQAHP